MPKTRKRQRTPITADPGPVKPGSPLHRALELVAREVAKSLETDPPPRNKQRKQRR
jgi:hypothetical protein